MQGLNTDITSENKVCIFNRYCQYCLQYLNKLKDLFRHAISVCIYSPLSRFWSDSNQHKYFFRNVFGMLYLATFILSFFSFVGLIKIGHRKGSLHSFYTFSIGWDSNLRHFDFELSSFRTTNINTSNHDMLSFGFGVHFNLLEPIL